ncbi:MAG: 2-dehydropantoate 2-reductase [Psychrobium sp.]|nr:2-dehydropantoate 2-reductase [Psychrobium sp.]
MTNKNILIIGNGAIGTLWAHYLTQAGHHIHLISRRQSSQTIDHTLLQHDGELALNQQFRILEHQSTSTLNALANIDLVLVTTKSYQIKPALAPYIKQLQHCPIILLHNGMGAIDTLDLASRQPILLATTSHGALRQDAHTTLHTGQGKTMIGIAQGMSEHDAKMITAVLENALPPVTYCTDINQALWQKLAINCAINALTAINNCRNGELAQQQYQATINGVLSEISQLTQRLNIALNYQQLRDSVTEVIALTATNFSSMQQDIKYKRRSEIEYINGYVVRQAKALNLKTPFNEQLYLAIKVLESQFS